MEPDVIRLYSSSPPPMEDAEEDDEDEFGDFGAFSTVTSSISFGEPEAPGHAPFSPNATSPPELPNGLWAAPGMRREAKANGVAPGSRPPLARSQDCSDGKRPESHVAGGDSEVITNGLATSVGCQESAGGANGQEAEVADFAPYPDTGCRLGGPGHGDGVHRGCAADTTGPDNESAPLPASCDGQADAKPREAHSAQDTAATCAKQALCATCDQVPDGVPRDGIEGVCLQGINGNFVHVDGTCGDSALDNGTGVDGPHIEEGVHVDMPRSDGRTSETETETETSLGHPLSTDALDEYGDVSTTGSPPPLQEENSTPADHSQLDEDEEFGDFGDAGPFCEQAFEGQEACVLQACDDFGDFGVPKPDPAEERGAYFADFAATNMSWEAFGETTEAESAAGESWAAFGSEDAAPPAGAAVEAWHQAETSGRDQDCGRHSEALWSRVEKLLEASFPLAGSPSAAGEERVMSLKTLVETQQDKGSALGGGVWAQLRDVHEALGLRHQWGGSYCNKTLLACLGIDTRNILFTGQKKQPLIVPVYAASLGMLEPTKEPAKPVSAAEMIASIAQAPTAATDANPCPSDIAQEALPPVQFDWSSSGLTNPLDGVDPELVELTTAKMDSGGAGGRMVDAFARLMSTVDKTSTSTRKPRKDEKLSSEASEVICGLPDLSFMTAKVLMFPATLVPPASQATPD